MRLRESGVAGRGPGHGWEAVRLEGGLVLAREERLRGPSEAGRGPSWKYRGLLQRAEMALPSQGGSTDGERQVPAGRVPKATESGAAACVSGHVGAGAVPGRPGAASLPGAPLSWR